MSYIQGISQRLHLFTELDIRQDNGGYSALVLSEIEVR